MLVRAGFDIARIAAGVDMARISSGIGVRVGWEERLILWAWLAGVLIAGDFPSVFVAKGEGLDGVESLGVEVMIEGVAILVCSRIMVRFVVCKMTWSDVNVRLEWHTVNCKLHVERCVNRVRRRCRLSVSDLKTDE